MITFENILEYTSSIFPDFKFDSSIDNQGTISSYLAEGIKKAIKDENKDLIIALTNFINELAINEDENIVPLVDDIALSIYSDGYYDAIKPYLTQKSLEIFDLNIDLWKKGNNLV